MNKYLEAYKLASNLTPKDMLDNKVRKAVRLVKKGCEKADLYDELVTPEFVLYKSDKTEHMTIRCPKCDNILHIFYCAEDTVTVHKHCNECGQKLKY